uniref:Replication protein A subunit n=1 Tax=Phallusia mammillata TaxID=59560 RepID=A0A6F9DRD8_9ASCI|nr:replication protein A 70 kDa DNA-binding subunit-like [Phallusia mammillata]
MIAVLRQFCVLGKYSGKMPFKLTEGAISALLNGHEPKDPILQCLGTKSIAGSGVPRMRLVLSDGVHSFATSMLATQLNDFVTDGRLQQNTVFKLKQYQSSVLQGSKRIVICLDIEILQTPDEAGGKIGEPVPLSVAQNAAGANGGLPNPSKPGNENVNPSGPNRIPPAAMYSPKPTGKMPFGKEQVPTTPGGTQTRVMPIGSLTPYQNKWSVKARVSQKGTMREWKNPRGEGKLFSFTVLDDSGDIRITCFKEEADKFYDMIEVGKVFYISNATLKPANAQYNNTTHDYEMTLRRDSTVTLCDKDDGKMVPKIQYKFVNISNLEQNISGLVDVIGVVKSVEDLNSVMIKSQNREAKVRKFNLVDQSGSEVTVTLWGLDAEKFDGKEHPVVAMKGAKVSDFNTCSLSAMGSTTISMNPDIPEAYQLKQWYESGGSTQATQSLTISSGSGGGTSAANWKTLADIKNENLGMKDKPDYITAKVTVLYCKKENVLYKACPNDQCNKKVIDLEQGKYRCEKCDLQTDEFKYRLILNMHVADEYESTWVTCFQEQGEILLKMSAQELGELQQTDENAFDNVLKRVDFQSYFMKLRVKMDRFNDEDRTRVTVVNVSPISNVDYIKKLQADIQKLQVE